MAFEGGFEGGFALCVALRVALRVPLCLLWGWICVCFEGGFQGCFECGLLPAIGYYFVGALSCAFRSC